MAKAGIRDSGQIEKSRQIAGAIPARFTLSNQTNQTTEPK